ncbi:MAG TPA: transcription initiation factor IIB family protein [Candidatus Bathyarchaeia archaeon]|nr:transcription initiation factor IIB family protein [Candidatus Bathyarchaeia archaeon]
MNLNSQQIIQEFQILKNDLGLSDRVIDEAKLVIRNASEKRLVRGRTHSTLVAAAVYIACRETDVPRPLHDIATIVNVKRKILAKYCRILMNKLYPNLPSIDPSKCIVKLADAINANEKAKRLAALMMKEIVKRELSAGKNPMAIAACILYICCRRAGYRTSQVTIAKAAGITDVTLRNRFREVKRAMHY